MLDQVSWKVRGVFASEANRRVGFWARGLCQPAEMLARRRAALELTAGLAPEVRVSALDGYLRLPQHAIPAVQEICAAGRAIAQTALEAGSNQPGGKSFSRNQLARGGHQRALLRIALDRTMISIAASYLGVLPVLTDVDYFLSLASARPWVKSQLWHCDDDAPRQLKVFVYCHDVGDLDGPFELVAASDSHKVRTAIGYRYAGSRYRVSDEVMDHHLPRDKQLSIRGPAGSVFVVDTARCFHKGSRIEEPGRHRIVGIILYCTPNAMHLPLRLATCPGPLANLAQEHAGTLERAVLGHPLAPGLE